MSSRRRHSLQYHRSSVAGTPMDLLLRTTFLTVYSTCIASAFVISPPASRCQSQLAVDSSVSPVTARVSRCSSRDEPLHSDRLATFDPRAASRRPVSGVAVLLSSRTVDVDVIDVTDVTEDESARQKEQVYCCSSAVVVYCCSSTTKSFLYNMCSYGNIVIS